MPLRRLGLAALAALCLAGSVHAQTSTGASRLRIVAHISGPDGGWDYATFDPTRRRLYIAHGSTVVSVDADTVAVTPAFAPGFGLHSVVPVPGADVIVTTNSGDNSARVIDARSGKTVASVPTGRKPDAAVFDPASGLVLVMNGASGDVTMVDPKARASAGSIAIGGALEFAQVGGGRRLYVNVEDKNEIAVVDIATRKVVARYPLAGCQGPTGLAYVAGNRLIAACANGIAEILDAATGKVIASPAIGRGPDAVLYDPSRRFAYIPCGRDGNLAVIALQGPANNTVIDTVKTQLGARTGAVDPRTGRIFLPTARFGPPAAAGERPRPLPGTFEVLVLGRR
jgi:DNA-binding beta-propeller fold protein YncE